MHTAQLTIIYDGAQWNADFPLSQDVLNKGWEPRKNTLGQTLGSHLSAGCPGQKQPHLHVYYKQLGRCLKLFLAGEQKKPTVGLLPPRYPKYKSKLHIFNVLRPQYVALPGHSTTFGVTGMTDNYQDTFYFSKYTMLVSQKRYSQNFHLPNRSQIASLIEIHLVFLNNLFLNFSQVSRPVNGVLSCSRSFSEVKAPCPIYTSDQL